MSANASGPPARSEIGFREFVAMIAALMAMNSLSIDPMLPALPAIGRALRVVHANDRQWIVTAYLLGLAGGTIVFGPLSDRFGRRPVTLGSIGLFVLATAACSLSSSYPVLLAARGTAGFFAASSRVISISIVRDRYQGDAMARVMSLIYVVFMIVPVIAPSIGQLILLFAPWRWIFGVLLVLGSLLLGWLALRLPETLPPDRRTSLNPADMGAALRRVITTRESLGYMLASGIVMACTVAFITSVQQIFADIFHQPTLFPALFAVISTLMALGGFVNSRLVERVGARRLSQSALIGLIAISALHAFIAWRGHDTLVIFAVLQALAMLCVSLAGSNLGAIGMEPFMRGAGFASSFQAFLAAVVSALLGALAGHAYNGTTVPMTAAFCLFGMLSLAAVSWSERGRLFGRSAQAMVAVEISSIEIG
jgi:DHA1 family bicyclomycin/chloramphenicol resistance-like MFS transporter